MHCLTSKGKEQEAESDMKRRLLEHQAKFTQKNALCYEHQPKEMDMMADGVIIDKQPQNLAKI